MSSKKNEKYKETVIFQAAIAVRHLFSGEGEVEREKYTVVSMDIFYCASCIEA